MTDIHIQDLPSESPGVPKVKPQPKSSAIHTPFSYFPSDDGTDENLLVLLHGLGMSIRIKDMLYPKV
jgi:hypothetical protein